MNKVIIMGRLTKEPEIKETASNIMVASFTLAVDRRVAKGSDKTADFINCVAWRQTAEFMRNYIHKGTRIAVSGHLQTRSWDDPEGKKRYVTEVIAEEVFFADSKQDGAGSGATRPFVSAGSNPGFNAGTNAGSNDKPQSFTNGSIESNGLNGNATSNTILQKNDGEDGFYPVEDDDLPF